MAYVVLSQESCQMAEPFLSLIQSQRMSQVLAPQLRQSLELLQVPILELRTLIQQEMEQNPTLDEQALEGEQIEIEPALNSPEEDQAFKDEFDKLAKLDDEWKDYFTQNQPPGESGGQVGSAMHAGVQQRMRRVQVGGRGRARPGMARQAFHAGAGAAVAGQRQAGVQGPQPGQAGQQSATVGP